MLPRNPMPRSHNPAFQKGESRFDGIRVSVPIHVDPSRVSHCLVLARRNASTLHCERIGNEFIRHNYIHIAAHVLFDVLCQRARLRVLGVEEAEIAAALPDANNYLFGFLASVDSPSDL